MRGILETRRNMSKWSLTRSLTLQRSSALKSKTKAVITCKRLAHDLEKTRLRWGIPYVALSKYAVKNALKREPWAHLVCQVRVLRVCYRADTNLKQGDKLEERKFEWIRRSPLEKPKKGTLCKAKRHLFYPQGQVKRVVVDRQPRVVDIVGCHKRNDLWNCEELESDGERKDIRRTITANNTEVNAKKADNHIAPKR